MARTLGTVVRGVRTPIIRQGDDLAKIVVDSLMSCMKEEGLSFGEKDIVGVTEAVVAKAQGNYANTMQIAKDVQNKFPQGDVGLVFPILSRNRFAICLRGLCMGAKKITLQLSLPDDEVGNHLVSRDEMEEKGINPARDVLTEEDFRKHFGVILHPFTGVDYIEYYKSVAREAGAEIQIIFSNDPRAVLRYTSHVICCDIHTRNRTQKKLIAAGAEKVLTLSDILNESVDGSGFNPEYGLLGTNKSTEDAVKLFPRDCEAFVLQVQHALKEKTGSHVEVLVYGDGAFKDPIGKIWELADPVVCPACTDGLLGVPNEVKLKYLADNTFGSLKGDDLTSAVTDYIKHKPENLKGNMASQGTTPRRLTDLIGSLCDLSSGSGDKGTPVIWIQGYFDNYAS